jgi:hypothetical protein
LVDNGVPRNKVRKVLVYRAAPAVQAEEHDGGYPQRMPDPPLHEKKFERRFRGHFYNPAFRSAAARSSIYRKSRGTLHCRGDGVFMLSGSNTPKYRRLFKRGVLDD